MRHRALFRFPFLILALLLSCAIEDSDASLGSKWLENKLRRIAEAHIETPAGQNEPSIPFSNLGEEAVHRSSPLLVVATHEGQVWTIDSTDGTLIAGFSTGPPLLVVDDQYEEATLDGESFPPAIPENLARSQIVPSMDGILYWRQPLTNNDNSDHGNSDHHSNSKLVPIVSIRDLVGNPIQICQELQAQNCDILTATSLGPSLFSLNSQGSLNWARARSSGTTTRVKPVPRERKSTVSDTDGASSDSDSASASDSERTVNNSVNKANLLLQRQDYLVQQISTETGEQVWNITWGNLEALDFMGDSDDASTGARGRRTNDDSFHFLPSDESFSSELPSLIFANQGRSLVALLTQPPKFLWKRDFISVVTNVLGIERDAWRAVNVVAENDGMDVGSKETGRRSSCRIVQPLLPDHDETQAEKDSFKYWWWAGGAKGLGKEDNRRGLEPFFVQSQEENGLVFVPRPHAHNLVRNSWFLNHLWGSLQKRGAQSFQKYLASEAHHFGPDTAARHEDSKFSKSNQLPYPWAHLDALYDTRSMPRLLLLPPSDHTLSSANTGGVFLSWTAVVAIITGLVGATGAAYILYGQKKRKWMATSTFSDGSDGGHGMSSGLMGDVISVSATRSRSQSIASAAERSHCRSVDQSADSALGGSDSNVGFPDPYDHMGRPPRYTLNRSCSAPMMTHNTTSAIEGLVKPNLLGRTVHNREGSPIIRSSLPVEKDAAHMTTELGKGPLVKHKSAPVEAPTAAPQGVGMIDGIPLIRYSRYQSEFREIEPLGRGGFGTVFRVANVLDGREYAVKKVYIQSRDWSSPGTTAFSQELHRVLREVKFLALLDHPNIVRYYTAWLEMEEDDELPGAKTSTNAKSNKMSRRFSSELLEELDETHGQTLESRDTMSFPATGPHTVASGATPSHLKPTKSANPLGWNATYADFEATSASAYRPKRAIHLPPSEDCGFIFEERSDGGGEEKDTSCANKYIHHCREHSVSSAEYSKSDCSHSVSSSWDASYSLNRRKKTTLSANEVADEEKKGGSEAGDPRASRNSGKTSRHTLYIQMQLCSAQTLGDFLSNREARQHVQSSGSEAVDVLLALRLFLQIVQAVHHVHQQNLIHRDLKPSNCFIDETGVVKVGDFGLSRESSDNNDKSANSSLILDGHQDVPCTGDNTVGVGTRSYASPEQMNGSDYDAKTDIYALGVMLFELLYPMYTGMERHICFHKLRSELTFPEGWHATVSKPFPSLDELVRSMLSLQPKDRPTADNVARQIQCVIDEHSVTLSISRHDSDNENVIFVRVEAKPVPDVLKITIDLIHEAAAPESVEIVQYGMRSGTKNASPSDEPPQKRAILEFALALSNCDPSSLSSRGSSLVAKLQEHDEILVARHVWCRKNTLANWGVSTR